MSPTTPEQRVGLIELPELLIQAADGLIQLRLHQRLAVQRSRLRHAAIEQGQHTKILAGPASFLVGSNRLSMNRWMRSVRTASAIAALRAFASRVV